jgi:hypothetical protein
VPHTGTDEWIENASDLIRDTLNPHLIPDTYIEWSNEPWNWGFEQAHYCAAIGADLWPGVTDGWAQAAGMKCEQMAAIVKARFAEAPAMPQIVHNVQTGWTGLAEVQYGCPAYASGGGVPCYTSTDGIAITCYFSGRLQYAANWPLMESWLAVSEAHAFSQAFRQLELGDLEGLVDSDGTTPITYSNSDCLDLIVDTQLPAMAGIVAPQNGVLVGYEGGTHFDHGPGAEQTAFLNAMCADDRMRGLYLKMFAAMDARGVLVFNLWGGIGSNAWGISPSMTSAPGPKYQAAIDWSAGFSEPSEVVATVAASLPAFTASASAHVEMPVQATADASLPAFEAAATAAFVTTSEAAIAAELPAFTAQAEAVFHVPSIADVAASLPAFAGQAVAQQTVAAELAATLPAFAAAATATLGDDTFANVAASLPAFEAQAEAHLRVHASIVAALPAFTASLETELSMSATVAASLPAFTADVRALTGDEVETTVAAELPAFTASARALTFRVPDDAVIPVVGSPLPISFLL